MQDVTLNRRRFLQGSGGLLLGTLIFGSGPIALLAPSRSWAMEMNTLSSDVAAKLLQVIRRVYPHDRMEDAVYAFAVKALDERASTDPSVLPLLDKGLSDLDRLAGGNWPSLDETRQVALLEEIQHSDFFILLRSTSVNSLYITSISVTKAPPFLKADI